MTLMWSIVLKFDFLHVELKKYNLYIILVPNTMKVAAVRDKN